MRNRGAIYADLLRGLGRGDWYSKSVENVEVESRKNPYGDRCDLHHNTIAFGRFAM